MTSQQHPLSPISPDGCIRDDGLWQAVRSDDITNSNGGPALFLDRDGVINVDTNYVFKVSELEIIPGAVDMIRAANHRGLPIVVVTNQSGVGRGIFDWSQFQTFQTALEHALMEQGAWINAAFACPYHKDALPPYRVDDHPGRKPNPGMILAATKFFDIDLSASWLVGDRSGDIEAARRASLAGGVLIG